MHEMISVSGLKLFVVEHHVVVVFTIQIQRIVYSSVYYAVRVRLRDLFSPLLDGSVVGDDRRGSCIDDT